MRRKILRFLGVIGFLGMSVIPNSCGFVEEPDLPNQTDKQGVEYNLDFNKYEAVITGCRKDITTVKISTSVIYKDKEYKIVGIEDNAFNSCTALEKVDMSFAYDLKYIGTRAFMNCRSLYVVIFPQKLTSIGIQAFYATSIIELIIPDSVQRIETNAFCQCHRLQKISLGKYLSYMGDMVFYSYSNGGHVYSHQSDPPECHGILFAPSLWTIHVPKGSEQKYSKSKGFANQTIKGDL